MEKQVALCVSASLLLWTAGAATAEYSTDDSYSRPYPDSAPQTKDLFRDLVQQNALPQAQYYGAPLEHTMSHPPDSSRMVDGYPQPVPINAVPAPIYGSAPSGQNSPFLKSVSPFQVVRTDTIPGAAAPGGYATAPVQGGYAAPPVASYAPQMNPDSNVANVPQILPASYSMLPAGVQSHPPVSRGIQYLPAEYTPNAAPQIRVAAPSSAAAPQRKYSMSPIQQAAPQPYPMAVAPQPYPIAAAPQPLSIAAAPQPLSVAAPQGKMAGYGYPAAGAAHAPGRVTYRYYMRFVPGPANRQLLCRQKVECKWNMVSRPGTWVYYKQPIIHPIRPIIPPIIHPIRPIIPPIIHPIRPIIPPIIHPIRPIIPPIIHPVRPIIPPIIHPIRPIIPPIIHPVRPIIPPTPGAMVCPSTNCQNNCPYTGTGQRSCYSNSCCGNGQMCCYDPYTRAMKCVNPSIVPYRTTRHIQGNSSTWVSGASSSMEVTIHDWQDPSVTELMTGFLLPTKVALQAALDVRLTVDTPLQRSETVCDVEDIACVGSKLLSCIVELEDLSARLNLTEIPSLFGKNNQRFVFNDDGSEAMNYDMLAPDAQLHEQPGSVAPLESEQEQEGTVERSVIVKQVMQVRLLSFVGCLLQSYQAGVAQRKRSALLAAKRCVRAYHYDWRQVRSCGTDRGNIRGYSSSSDSSSSDISNSDSSISDISSSDSSSDSSISDISNSDSSSSGNSSSDSSSDSNSDFTPAVSIKINEETIPSFGHLRLAICSSLNQNGLAPILCDLLYDKLEEEILEDEQDVEADQYTHGMQEHNRENHAEFTDNNYAQLGNNNDWVNVGPQERLVGNSTFVNYREADREAPFESVEGFVISRTNTGH